MDNDILLDTKCSKLLWFKLKKGYLTVTFVYLYMKASILAGFL